MPDYDFLPGVPANHVLDRLAKADGNEISSGKLSSLESSAALAVNTFGWFIDRCDQLPPLPGMDLSAAVTSVEVEYCARFPFTGGRHPWLDAIVETERLLVGVESKRYEPYRGYKPGTFSEAYDRDVWGNNMGPYKAMRDLLRSGAQSFEYLNAAQLVKHAFGLVTESGRKGKEPALVYLFAEPPSFNGKPISPGTFAKHRAEIARFATAVSGAQVTFHSISYREWLATWPLPPNPVGLHGKAVIDRFQP